MSTLYVILANGGFVLWPIALMSVAALTVVIERTWRLFPLRRKMVEAQARCNEALLHGGPDQALSVLKGDDPLTRVLRAGLSVRYRGPETVRAVALDAAQREIPNLERGIGIVLASTQIAPLLGLLGTVIGLIEAFQAVSTAEGNSIQTAAGGIYMALGTTALGLFVAIPCFIAYGLLSSLSNRIIDQLEHAATDLPLLVREPGEVRR
jgi:biopolymer transport protein ExbB